MRKLTVCPSRNLSVSDLYRLPCTLAILWTAIRAVETREEAGFNGRDIRKDMSFVYGAVGFPTIGRFVGGRSMPMVSESTARPLLGRYPNIPPKQVLGEPRKLCASPLTRRRPSWPNAPYRFRLSSSITPNMSFVPERRRRRNPLQRSEPIRIFYGFTSNRSGAISNSVRSDR